MINRLKNILTIIYFRLKGVNIPDNDVTIHISSHFTLMKSSTVRGKLTIHKHCGISKGVVINTYGGYVTINQSTFLGEYVVIYGHGGVEIGENTLIAMHTCIVSSNHTIPPPNELIRYNPDILLPVKIGSDVWIGAGCKILGAVTIGDGCVVGAGSVVTGDLPPFSISVGSPAKVIRYREGGLPNQKK